MPSSRRKAGDLPGDVPDSAAAVLMLVDVNNDLDIAGNAEVVRHAASLGRTIAALKARCRKAGIPAVASRRMVDECRQLDRTMCSREIVGTSTSK